MSPIKKKKKRRRRSRAAPIAWTDEERDRVLTVAKAESVRDWLWMLVGYWHGLRVSELLALTPRHFRDGKLTVQRLKGSLKTRQTLRHVEDQLLDERTALTSYLRTLRSDQKLFNLSRRQADRLMKHYGEIAQIPAEKRCTKVLKHSCGRHFMPKIGAEHTRQLLGHVDIRNTQVYGWVTDEEADSAVNAALSKS